MALISRFLLLFAVAAPLIGGGCSDASAPAGQAEAPQAPVVPAPPPAAAAAPSCGLPVYNLQVEPARGRRLSETAVRMLVRQAPRLKRLFGQYSRYDNLFALDTLQCTGFTLVPLLHEHEECCQELYYLIFQGPTFVQVQKVASSGGDGQWGKASTLTLLPNGRLRVISREADAVAVEEADVSADTAATLATLHQEYYALDSVTTEFVLTPQGKLVRIPIDSVRLLNRQL